MTKDKAAIRSELLTKRRTLTRQEAGAKAKAIGERLESLTEYAVAERVLTYVSSKDNEVDTLGLIERAMIRGRPVGVPVSGPGGHLAWSRLHAIEELARGRFGILEPPPEYRRPLDPNFRDVVVVPGIGFTPDGERIGYGGGYFDRFLARFTGVSIGIAYAVQMVASFPCDAHDVPVDMVVTESEVYRRGACA